MNDSNIYRIAHLITEDPDLIDESNVVVTYTNSTGKTNQYSIIQAWPKFKLYPRREFIGYSIEWPNNTLGFFKLDGLSTESYKLLISTFGGDDKNGTRNSYKMRMRQKELRKSAAVKAPSSKMVRIWEYMFKTYGRCCPDWFKQGHAVASGGCLQSGREQGAALAPDPYAAHLIAGDYPGGLTIENSGGPDGDWTVTLPGEQEATFSNADDAMEHISDRLSQPDMEDFRAELYDARANIRHDANLANNRSRQQREQDVLAPAAVTKTIESDYGPITITKQPDGSIEVSMEGEESIEFEDPKAASSFLRYELGIETLIEHKKQPRRVLLEGIGPKDIERILTELGYSNVNFIVPNDNEFQRLDVFGGAYVNDKMYQLGEPMTDISEEQLKQAIARIEAGGLTEISPEDAEELEELQDDSSLFVIATKQVGGKFVGITLMSLDDPALQFNSPDWKSDDGDDEAMSVDDLSQMFDAPSFEG